jgi:putative restriction endonuclease
VHAIRRPFGDSFTAATAPIDPLVLRRACTTDNGQLAMRPLDPDRLDEETAGSARRVIRQLLGTGSAYLAASDALLSELESGRFSYEPPTHDSRELVMQQIRLRRGQKAFRQALRDRYGDRCMVTGCELVDILEAAHISPLSRPW